MEQPKEPSGRVFPPNTVRSESQALVHWFKTEARPFFATNAPEVLPPLDNDAERLEKILARTEHVTICFLGHSGVGKSTLLNALVAGRDQVLPAGGIGPLTALATEVAYSERPCFRVSYHKRGKLWRLVFALERMSVASNAATNERQIQSIPLTELGQEERQELESEITAQTDADASQTESPTKLFVKQAQQIITGHQFEERPIAYLIDGLRLACGFKPKSDIRPDDLARIERIQKVLALAETSMVHERFDDGTGDFAAELKDHAAGFLAPLIEKIDVGWPSNLLDHGVTLADLPGVGIAQDVYRQITQRYIRSTARAVILTIDRAGLTAETIDLLRTSGYWDRLVGAIDDPTSDPCYLFIAVTKVDDVASEEWRNLPDSGSTPKPKKREVYARLVDDFKARMKSQISGQLGNVGVTSNVTLQDARAKARATILETLEIHPVSAPEYRKILRDDEDDRPFLQDESATGIPTLRITLERLAKQERATLEHDVANVAQRLRESAAGELRRLETIWRDRTQVAGLEDAIKQELETFLAAKRKERDLRTGAFREFLDSTSQTKIKQLVGEAREIAEEEVNQFLNSLQDAHWATLRAAVTRGGSFHGSRAINLPDDVAIRFQEPMAGVWSTKLLVDVRKRTGDFASDHTRLVDELADWARSKTPSNSQAELIEQQRQRIARHADQMRQAGKEAVGELRQTVKVKIAEVIRKPIKQACEKFVSDGEHIGRGVKTRILELFGTLAKKATKAAQEPATAILEQNFSSVRSEIKTVFDEWGDPLQETADIILQRSAGVVTKESDAGREQVLSAIESLLAGPAVKTETLRTSSNA